MANLVITETANKICIVFNDSAVKSGFDKCCLTKSCIYTIRLEPNFVSLISASGEIWKFTYNATDYFQVDSVAGAAPSSNSDLYDKIEALI